KTPMQFQVIQRCVLSEGTSLVPATRRLVIFSRNVGGISIRACIVSRNIAPRMSVSKPEQKVGGRLDIESRSHAIFVRVEGLAIMPVHSVVAIAELRRQPTEKIIAPLETDAILGIRKKLVFQRHIRALPRVENDISLRQIDLAAVVAQPIVPIKGPEG